MQPKKPKIKVMPLAGRPQSVTIRDYGNYQQSIYGSQMRPAEVDEATADRLKKEHGWVDWEPREVEPLPKPPKQVRMMGTKNGPNSVVVQRRDSGEQVMYPGHGSFDVDERDVDALSSQGFVPVISGSSRPRMAGLVPGTRFVDKVSGNVSVLGPNGWYSEVNA